MKLYLVRHGITDWNARKKIQGQVDIPLNEEGKRLAIKLVTMYSSEECPEGRFGKRKRMSGLSFREAWAMIPPFSAIFISPIHIERTPIIVMHKETASFDESMAAFVISGIRPVKEA